ncbi:hypothetical protein BDF22DRAFT_401471 [Syncephalis plumigaleata]|nr:hypothetical protein BDF22DRAFT_401471 [Syncephalis plumigaleata]
MSGYGYSGYNAPPPGGYPPQQNAYPPNNPGGHGSWGPPRPPAGADPQLWQWFKAIDIDGSGELTCDELQQALVNGDWQPFNIETVRLMMNLFDVNNDGRIGFNEFAGLWKYIEDWKRCFQSFDTDRSGTIDCNEMKQALLTFGYNLNDRMIQMMITRYDKHGRGTVTFDNFIQACVTVKTLTEAFRKFDKDGVGWVYISYEQFLELVINNR